MRVLQINSVCGKGSTGRITVDLYNELVTFGNQGCIAYGRGTAPSNIKSIKIGSNIDVLRHVLLTRLFDAHGYGSRKSTKLFLNAVKEYEPDIIHLHNIHGYYINIKLLFEYIKTEKIPVLWTFHDTWAFSGHSAYIDLDENGNLPKKNTEFSQRKEYPESFLWDRSSKNYEMKKKLFSNVDKMKIITPSHWLADLSNKSFFNEYPISVIHNGIDLENFKVDKEQIIRKKYKLENKKIVLGVANIWEERKGLKYFNSLASLLSDNYQIILVGDVRGEKVDERIIHIPQTTNIKELSEFYSAADVYLNPTLKENFPTTNIESLACGTPVITFDSGGSKEMLSDETGIVLTQKNMSSILESVNKIVKNNDISELCIKQSRLFDKHNAYSKYISEYQKIFSLSN